MRTSVALALIVMCLLTVGYFEGQELKLKEQIEAGK